METHQPPRKACDLCYRKKIKCDGLKPRCSSCRLRHGDCTYGAASRKTPSRKQAAVQQQLLDATSLHSQVASLEGQINTILERLDKLEGAASSEIDTSILTPPSTVRGLELFSESADSRMGDLHSLWDALSMAEHYLATCNHFLPLFDPETLLQRIRRCYQTRGSRDPIDGALLNVVLALSLHTCDSDQFAGDNNAAVYLNNAQSFLTEVMTGDIELINVQILLGLVILFGGADDLSPASTLIATALRLAHKLGLHTRRSSEHLDPPLALQRSRVFWIAYILDRDISLRAGLPPIQAAADIDLELPPYEGQNDLGFVFPDGKNSRWNYFRSRVELANIQAKVYDCVYSVSAHNYSSEERTQNVAIIFHALDTWSSQIPHEFHATTLSQTDPAGLSKYFYLLYASRLSCRTLISFASHRDSFHNSRWLGRLQNYGDKVATGQILPQAPLPLGWETLVKESREFLMLHATLAPADKFFLQVASCPHTSGLIFLIANKIINVHSKPLASDTQLTRTAMIYLDDVVKGAKSEKAQEILDAVRRLSSYADLISQNELNWMTLPNMDYFRPVSQTRSVDIDAAFNLGSIP